MDKESKKKSYIWLLHIAIWVLIFGLPFFSPRPGHPLHGGVNYARFIPTLVSFLFVFYINYFVLIRKYLYTRKFWYFILWNLLIVGVAETLVHLTFKMVYPMPAALPRPPVHRPFLDTLSFLTRNMTIYFAVICVAIAVKMTERWYEDENRRKELEKSSAEAELAALKSQVNPHFLFNTLNNIYSLISIDQGKAQEAVHDLGGLMRYVLYESENHQVPLDKEVLFLKDYIKLMGMRYSQDVRIDVDLPEVGSRKHIAPMLFLPLVENAFKHGVSDESGSFIRVKLREDSDSVTCLVENSYHPKDDSDRSGSGIGIKNLCRRLDMLYPGQHSFEYGKVMDTYRCLLRIDTEVPAGKNG